MRKLERVFCFLKQINLIETVVRRNLALLDATKNKGLNGASLQEMNMKQSKKIKSAAEIAWRQAREDERWEIRVEYLQEVFSHPSCCLPRQIAHQNKEDQLLIGENNER